MLTDLWPTTEVQFTSDEHAAILAGLVVKNASGAPRPGVLPRHTSALVTARPDMRVNVLPMELVHVKEGARFAALTETVDLAIPNPPSANTQYNIVAYVGTDRKLTGTASTSEFIVVPGTPSATPSDPALPDAAIPIARVAVPSTATATNSAGVVITPLHQFTAAAGGTVLFRSTTARDAWVPMVGQTAVVGSSLAVYSSAGWRAVPNRLGSNRRSADLLVAGPGSWSDLLTVTAVSSGGLCVADFKQKFRNGNSGAFRATKFRVMCDGVQVGDAVEFSTPLDTVPTGFPAVFDVESTPGAGTHTWVLQAQASLASAVFASNGVLTVTEN